MITPKQDSIFRQTLVLDLRLMFRQLSTWLILAVWLFFTAFFFSYYLDDFSAIQAELIAKNIDASLMRLVVAPYLKTTAPYSIALFLWLASPSFKLNCFSAFSPLYQSMQPHLPSLILSKVALMLSLALLIVLAIFLPVFALAITTELNMVFVFFSILTYLLFLLEVGYLTLIFAKHFEHSIAVAFLVVGVIGLFAITSRLLAEPIWLASWLQYFSPYSHFVRAIEGVFLLSHFVFFISLSISAYALLYYSFENDKLPR